MKKRKIVISLLVVAVLLFAGVYANANEMDTKVTEKNDVKKLHEIESKRTLSSRAYAMSDGTISHELFATNINYKDKSGKLQKIDIKVKDLDTKRSNGYKFSNGANDWDVYFADKGKAKDMVKIKQGSYEIGFSMNKTKEASVASKSSGLARSKSKIHDYYREDPTVVIYNDVQPNVDLAYTIREGYLKEEIVLNNKPTTNQFSFDINVKNISLVLKDNTLYYNDAKTGKTVFSSSNLFMHDSEENYSDNVAMKLDSKEKNVYTLTVVADEKFLNDENTKYPVVIDPTIQNNSTYDVFVASKYNMDDTNMNSGSSRAPYLRTGKDSDYYVRRTYIKFRDSDISNAVGNNRIVGANVSLMRYSSKGSINIRAYRAASSWNSSSLTWNNRPGYINSSYKSGSKWGTTDWYRINLTDWAKGWANGSITNNGLVIRDTNEGSTSVWATFRSSDNWATDRRPKLEIITISPEPTPVPTAVPTAVPTPTPTSAPTATPAPTETPGVDITSVSPGSGYILAGEQTTFEAYISGNINRTTKFYYPKQNCKIDINLDENGNTNFVDKKVYIPLLYTNGGAVDWVPAIYSNGNWHTPESEFETISSQYSDTHPSYVFLAAAQKSFYTGIDTTFYYNSHSSNSFRGYSTPELEDGVTSYNCLAYAIGINSEPVWEWYNSNGYGRNPSKTELDDYMLDQTRAGTHFTTPSSDKKDAKVIYYSDQDWGSEINDGHFGKVITWDSNGNPTSIYSKWGYIELIYSSSYNPFTTSNGLYGAAKRYYK